jgi:uncharacterized protein
VTIEVVARPGASRTGFHRVAPQGVVIGVAAVPERGKANAELIAFLAKMLDVPRSSITILRGDASRHKTIRIVSKVPAVIADVVLNLGESKAKDGNLR